jgi:hypothetical protein
VRNGTETGVDCGGTCPRCANGQGCAGRNDCQGAWCLNATCQACTATFETCGSGCLCLPSLGQAGAHICASTLFADTTPTTDCNACPAGTVACESPPIGGLTCFPRCTA